MPRWLAQRLMVSSSHLAIIMLAGGMLPRVGIVATLRLPCRWARRPSTRLQSSSAPKVSVYFSQRRATHRGSIERRDPGDLYYPTRPGTGWLKATYRNHVTTQMNVCLLSACPVTRRTGCLSRSFVRVGAQRSGRPSASQLKQVRRVRRIYYPTACWAIFQTFSQQEIWQVSAGRSSKPGQAL